MFLSRFPFVAVLGLVGGAYVDESGWKVVQVASLLTYYTLCAENHRWWWRAFLAPATTGLYVFGYAAYYYGAHLQEEAFDALQAGLFFGYMLLVSLGVALVAGAAGFLASLKFLAYIFAQIKFD